MHPVDIAEESVDLAVVADGAEIFQDINDISKAFENTLEIFYKDRQSN
jgi:hypothetical protein